jgi:DNA replication initiation complex subunit (GINS family)
MPDHYSLLLDWRRLEGSVRGLAKLPPDFYPSTVAYLAELRRTFEGELRENPGGRKGDVARQTHQRASQVGRDIYEARMTKLLSAAFQASAGGAKDVGNILPEERALFDGLVKLLRDHRTQAAPFLDPYGPTPPTPRPAAAGPAPSVSNPPSPSPPSSPPRAARSLVFVRVLKDGRPIEVGGETIDLRREDILSLTPETAKILIESQIAERVRPDERSSIT